MKKSLQYFLAFIEFVCASVASEVPDYQWEIRIVGICLGIAYIAGSQNPFKIISNLEIYLDDLNEQIEEDKAKLNNLTQQQKLQIQAAYEELEINRKKVEDELADRQNKIFLLAQQQEQIIQQKIEEANEQLELDKQEFILAHQQQVENLESRIEQLECDLSAAYETIASYELPQLPDGVSQHELASRRVIEILQRKGCIADYRGSWREDGFILVRVRPRSGSEAEVKKHLKLIELELDLAEPVRLATKEGAIQMWLRPQEMIVTSPAIAPEPKWTVASEDSGFIEPNRKLSPYGEIRSIEIEWVEWLYHHHHPKPVRNQIEIIRRIWGASNGSRDYSVARDRLRKIFDRLGIKSRQKSA